MEMETARLHREQPDFTFNDDSQRYLKAPVYLDPEDPLDSLLLEEKEAGFPDTLPTPAEQNALIAGLKQGNLDCVRELVERHRGIVMAVAYPFKLGSLGVEDLLHTGRHALIEAAKTYDKEQDGEFSDYAARHVHQAFGALIPERAGDSFLEIAERPMEGVYQFVENTYRADSPAKLRAMRARTEEQEGLRLNDEELQVVNLLHLTNDMIGEILGIKDPRHKVNDMMVSIKNKLGAKTREEAAIIAWRRGVHFDVRDIPGKEYFTLEERQVAARLYMPNKAIAKDLEFGIWAVTQRIAPSLRAKAQVRSRAELALLAQMHAFEPTEEELNPPKKPLSERLSSGHAKVIKAALYMKDKDIAEVTEIGFTEYGISNIISRHMRQEGLEHHTRTALILELHRQGMDFDIREPSQPMAEAFDAQEIRIIQRLHWNYQEIIDDLGLGCNVEGLGEIVGFLRRKVGARSRQELALMADVYYDEDILPAREVDRETHEWALVRHLGVHALEGYTWEQVLPAATEREQEVINAYFLTPGKPTWDKIGEEFKLSRDRAKKIASSGIHAVRKGLHDGSIANALLD